MALALVHCAKRKYLGPELIADEDAVTQAMRSLEIGYAPGDNAGHVTRNIKLPATGKNGVTIAWASDKPKIINTRLPGTGIVIRDDNMNKLLTLTATLTKGTTSAAKTFLLTVIHLPFWSEVDRAGGGEGDSIWEARNFHKAFVFDDKMWIMGGMGGGAADLITNLNDMWWSTDGAAWTKASNTAGWSSGWGHAVVVFGGKIWVIGGPVSATANEVWSSNSGTAWASSTVGGAQWSVRWNHTAVVFDGKMWILGGDSESGQLNDVWWSTDGTNWTNANASEHWSARTSHASVVFDEKMWVLGGFGGSYKNDVWWSSDGTTWTKTTVSGTHWPARRHHTAVVFDDKMWVLSGYDGSSNLNDVWWSTDGSTWTKLTNGTSHWPARGGHASVVFDNKIWVMGGSDGSNNNKNDVWVYQQTN